MLSPFAIIGNAWSFYKKQPVLNEIAFWLMFLPVATIDALGGLAGTAYAQDFMMNTEALSQMTAMEVAVAIPIFVFIVYFYIWGQASVLIVAKRLVSSPAGRTRTSFKAVRKQAKKYIATLFLTELLRTAITLLLMLLLIVPGIIYSIRTVFYDIMMIEKGKVGYGRPMLKRSISVVKGHTWSVLWRAVVISLCIFAPVALVQAGIMSSLVVMDARLETLGLVLADAVEAFGSMIFVVSLVALYANLKETTSTTS